MQDAKRSLVCFFLLAISVSVISAQDIAASAATAQGYEGLLFNPAAVAVNSCQAAGFGAAYASAEQYSWYAALADSFLLRYDRDTGEQSLNLAWGLGFPLFASSYAGIRTGADLLDFSWRELELSTGVLFYPHRYLAVGATQEQLLDPEARSFTFGIGIRPFSERLTLFGDLILAKDSSPSALDWAAGLRAEPVDGLGLGFRSWNEFREYSFGLTIEADALNLDLSLAGDFRGSSLRMGAGLRYDFRPSRSFFNLGAKTYRLPLSKPIDRNSTKKESLNNLDSLIARICQLADDRRSETLVLEIESGVVLSVDVLEELYQAFSYFKSKGKRIVTYIDSSFSELSYLAAAAGDTVVVPPYSLVPLVGVGARLLFFKNLFEELEIDVEYVRSSEYKAALDRFIREKLSEENRQQLVEYLEVSYELILDILVSCRGLTREQAQKLVDGGPYWAGEAAELGLVDEVLYYEDFEELYLEELRPGRLNYLEYQSESWRRPQIAVVKASGPIVASETLGPWDWLSGRDYITEANLIPVLERLGEDPRVAAVVLQVDSGGGDGRISDRIWRAIMELKKAKTVVVVMGRAAASGGYYLAMCGDRVFARSTTLTGSIGSYSFKIAVQRLLERYGITTDAIEFGENVEMFSPFTSMSPGQRQRLEELNNAFTERFYGKVAEARDLSSEQVEELGGGRIYSGERALELNLVDEIGGVYQALRYLEDRLDLDPEGYVLEYYPDRSMLFLLALQKLRENGSGIRRDTLGLLRLMLR